jgi:adenylate kinase family enzyme
MIIKEGKVIIIEGPEGSGKTTLAKMLEEEAELNYHHSTGPPEDVADLDNRLDRSMELLNMRFVQDRSPWISEPIYSALLDGPQIYPYWNVYMAGLKAVNAKVVYCRPPDEIIFENMLQDEKSWKSASLTQRIVKKRAYLLALYDRFMEQFQPWLIYDWTRESSAPVEKSLIRQTKKWADLMLRGSTAKQLPQSQNEQSGNDSGE